MKISAMGEYAVRIMVDIAGFNGYVSLKDVAQRQDISLKKKKKIVSKLIKNGLLVSKQGQDGGYKLAKKPSDCTIRQVLEITGDVSPVAPCVQGDCPHKQTCASVSVWQKLNGLINDYLGHVTIFDLLQNKN